MATWEVIWMLVVLKIPVVYLFLVVWWAIRAEPRQLEPSWRRIAAGVDRGPGRRFLRPRSWHSRPGPHRSPTRDRDRTRTTRIRAEAR